MEKEVLKLDNNTITFERSIIFIASNSKKAKKSFENVRNIKTLSFEKYDLTNYLDHTKDKELILYSKLRTVIQNISFTVVDGILFATNKESKITPKNIAEFYPTVSDEEIKASGEYIEYLAKKA